MLEDFENLEEEPRYIISIAAQMVGVETHTLRYYERIGIVSPARSRGNIRLYSERDIALLRQAKALLEDLGVNLAGIDVIIRMTRQMQELQQQLQYLQSQIDRLERGE